MKKTLLLALAVAGVLTLAANTNAGDVAMSPKAKELADSLRKAPGTTVDMIDRSVKAGSPKANDLAESLRRVPGTSIDVAHGPRPTMSPRDPNYEQALRNMGAAQIGTLK